MEWIIKLFASLITSYIGALLLLVIGIVLIKKSTNSGDIIDDSVYQPNLRGVISGGGFIVLAIAVFVMKLLGVL